MKKNLIKIMQTLTLSTFLILSTNPSMVKAQDLTINDIKTKAVSLINNVLSKPEISFVGVGHSPLCVGDTENVSITTKSSKNVQYKIYLHDDARKTTEELTNGYSELVKPTIPYEINPSHVYQLGKYKLEIWVREEGSAKEYDNT